MQRNWNWLVNKVRTNKHGSFKESDFLAIHKLCMVIMKLEICKYRSNGRNFKGKMSESFYFWIRK